MYKVDIQPEKKEAAAAEARRNQEKQRQSRIFNVRNRVIGVDVEALNSQVDERKRREAAERAREAAFDAERVHCDLVAQLLEREQAERAQRLARGIQEFRDQEQQPEGRREFDLNDPAGLQKALPARVGDDDPRCGPASLQLFAGEALSGPSQQRLQREQNRKDLVRQRAEQQRAEAEEKYAAILEDKKRIELDLRATHLAELEEACRRAKDLAVADFNRAQAAEVAEQRRLARQQEDDDNLAEIYNHLTGDVLTENPQAAQSKLAPHRVVPDRWKGMSPEQQAAIHHAQESQRQDDRRRRQKERQLEAEWERQRQLGARAALELERQQRELARRLRRGQDLYNRQLAQEQRAHKEYLDKVVYTNQPTAQYHLQFNSSSR
ncbi:RIB43A-like with coiled-coils protein 1 [Ornithorhynchus anatinus]|uniref:RIB43A-like with coiled-coils protein 1 n=1 Tax=Ornithorhynchus anatinus TaxID=9258 RepID=UPI0000EDCB19|nr:RIB43A-like with coiled-coils protein 1 [Ornithorhynchus anatinus]